MTFSGRATLFAFLIAVTLLLIFLHIRGLLRPVESALVEIPRPFIYVLSGTGHSIGNFFGYFSSVSRLNNQNAILVDRVRELEQENVALQQYKLQNEMLKKELGFRDTAKFNLIPGTVIAKDPSAFSETIIINIGSKDGVQTGSGVLSQGVLIGRISEVETFTSKVLLVTDSHSAIDVQVGNTGDQGIVHGTSSGMALDMVSQNTQLNKGDLLVTAGLTQQLPKGILLGSVGDLISQKNDLWQKATVISGVDLDNLDYVSVIKQ